MRRQGDQNDGKTQAILGFVRIDLKALTTKLVTVVVMSVYQIQKILHVRNCSVDQMQHWSVSGDYSTRALLLILVTINRILVLYLTLLSTHRCLTNYVKDRLLLNLTVRWSCRIECPVCKGNLSYILSFSTWKNAELNHTHFTLLAVQKAQCHITPCYNDPV
jgi:hypothetical protein